MQRLRPNAGKPQIILGSSRIEQKKRKRETSGADDKAVEKNTDARLIRG